MHSLIQIGFENFRLFKDLTLIDIEMLTILTGPNNSGKSTVLEGLNILINAANHQRNSLRRIDIPAKDLVSRGSRKRYVKFITGIHAETAMEDILKLSPGEEFVLRVNHYYVERSYKAAKNALELRSLKFCRKPGMQFEFLKFVFKSPRQVQISLDPLEFLKLNEMDIPNLINEKAYSKLCDKLGYEPMVFDMPAKDFLISAFFKSVNIIYDIRENNKERKRFYVYESHERATKTMIPIEFSTSANIAEEGSSDAAPLILTGVFLQVYYRYLETYLCGENSLQFTFENNKGEDIEFKAKELINEKCIKGLLKYYLVFNTISEIENKPINFLWGGPSLQVNRAISYRAQTEDNEFQKLLERSKVLLENSESKENKQLSAILKHLGIGASLEIKKDRNGKLSLWIIDENNASLNIQEFGFGTNQIIPIILKMFDYEEWMNWRINFLISEPEANLHPDLQSRFMEILAIVFKEIPYNFIIETHSEYMIRKLRLMVAKKEFDSKYLRLYYFNKDENNNVSVNNIEILKDGSLSQDFGPGFMDEADNLAIDLFNLTKQQRN